MIEPLAALAFTVFGVILGGGVLFALWFDRVPLETHQAVIESGKAHREYRDELSVALKARIRELEWIIERYTGLLDRSNTLIVAHVKETLELRAQLAKVHRKRDPKTGRWAK